MAAMRCPGQDTRTWGPDDVFDVLCPHCQTEIEFFKDDPRRPCGACGAFVRNPKLDVGCAEWCEAAHACLGSLAPGAG